MLKSDCFRLGRATQARADDGARAACCRADHEIGAVVFDVLGAKLPGSRLYIQHFPFVVLGFAALNAIYRPDSWSAPKSIGGDSGAKLTFAIGRLAPSRRESCSLLCRRGVPTGKKFTALLVFAMGVALFGWPVLHLVGGDLTLERKYSPDGRDS